jgi:HEAT repeat protein
MSEAALAHVQALRRERATQRQVQRLAMLESPEAAVRQDAVFELDADDEQDLAALTSALGDPDPAVRAEAVRQLQFGEPGAVVPLLVQALADLELPVVLEAVDSLKFLGEPGAIPDLEPLLEHPDPRVQTEARAAIERLR